MRDLIILGAGVHGLEMAQIVQRVNAVAPTWNLRGYIGSNDQQAAMPSVKDYPMLGGPDDLAKFPDACFVPDNAFPRHVPVEPDRLVTLIDPSCFVAESATIGCGGVLYPFCYVGENARLDDYVFVLSSCVVNHDDVLERNVVLASGARLAGFVHVEQDCYIGQGCSVRENARIGRGSLIGTGAVVVRDVPSNSVMVGNPARKLRDCVEEGQEG